MLLSRRYRNNWGYQIQQDRRDPIFRQYIERPNRNEFEHDGYNTYMTFDTLTNDDINVTQKASQAIIKSNGIKPGNAEDQQGEGIGDVARKAVAKFASIPIKVYTSSGANKIRNALGKISHRKDKNWRPGFKNELHVPGYSYCGPGTNIDARLKRGDPGLNQLDRACKIHDIDYALAKTPHDVRSADMKFLQNIKKSKDGKKSHKRIIKTIFNKKMKMEDKGKLSHGKFTYESSSKTTTDPSVLQSHKEAAQESLGEGPTGIIKMMSKRRKKDPARKLRKKMKKYRAGSSNKVMKAALIRLRKKMNKK